MTISMYQAALPTLIRQLNAISAFLTKGEAYATEQGIDPADLIGARLAPDMFALARQVQIATDLAKGGGARLAGETPPAYTDDETSFADLRARLAKTVDYLKSLPADAIDGSEEREIVLTFGPENELRFTGQDYLLHFVLPNVFFHATTAYDILRNKGVPLGKRDFIGSL